MLQLRDPRGVLGDRHPLRAARQDLVAQLAVKDRLIGDDGDDAVDVDRAGGVDVGTALGGVGAVWAAAGDAAATSATHAAAAVRRREREAIGA